jgi:hypothetical protein
MILAYHLIFSAYGFWLPNDPRGSGSHLVRSENLLEFGEATKVAADDFCARKPHDRAKRLAAKAALDPPPVSFTGVQARAIARGVRELCAAIQNHDLGVRRDAGPRPPCRGAAQVHNRGAGESSEGRGDEAVGARRSPSIPGSGWLQGSCTVVLWAKVVSDLQGQRGVAAQRDSLRRAQTPSGQAIRRKTPGRA